MLIVIPTRIIPGVLFAALFVFVGVGAGVAVETLWLHPSQLRWLPGSFLLLFPLACHYVWSVWREGSKPDLASEVTALSPRLMAVVLGVCLIVGAGAGGMMTYATSA